ncbi:MAG: hypothetical protein U0936_03075 [Planctomycetaceae bacterium]
MAVLPALPKVAIDCVQGQISGFVGNFSKDGQTILAGRFKLVEQRRVDNNERIWSLPIADGKVNSLRLSPDGTRVLLATGTPGLAGRAVEVVIGQDSIRKNSLDMTFFTQPTGHRTERSLPRPDTIVASFCTMLRPVRRSAK